ncbi:MAG: NAD(P)/FAD-dependent oxidoreductase [Sphingopyxis sp.]
MTAAAPPSTPHSNASDGNAGNGSGTAHMADVIIIGGGIAGLSAAAALAPHRRVVVVEGEAHLGHHSSGRSATFCHYGIGNAVVRGLTSFSREFLQNPPADFADHPLVRPKSALFIATDAMREKLDSLANDMARFSPMVDSISPAAMHAMVPVLRCANGAPPPPGEETATITAGIIDPSGLKLDTDAMMQGFARRIRRSGGRIATGHRVAAIHRTGQLWAITCGNSPADSVVFTAPIIINAAGAWADDVARMAGVRPIGLMPKRRTMIVLDPPAGMAVGDWPFVKTAIDEFYMIPDSGRLMLSPVDEVDSEPTDAQPEDYDIALAAWRAQQYTTLPVNHIAHRWAGLRSFVADRVPTAGFDGDAEGFFWLTGQGGYGIQTAPAMAAITHSLITGGDWPADLTAHGVTPRHIDPQRLRG